MGAHVTGISSGELQTLAHPSSAPPDVVVLDLRAQGQMPPALSQIKRQHPDVGFVMVVSSFDPALMLEAMRSGVTECVNEAQPGELEAAVNRLVSQRVVAAAGDVFVFVGAKGGVGTTTAAVNVATALAKYGSTLLIDLHLTGGDAALFLGVDVHFSVIDALENTHRLDASFFRGLLARTKSGEAALLASSDRAVAMTVDAPRVRTLIDFAARHYRYTVLDIPRSDAQVLDSLEAATKIIVVANQELATVRSAGRVAGTLRQRYGKGTVVVALSRFDKHAEIGIDDLQRAVGGAVEATFPSDYRLAVKALNRGQPLVADGKTALAGAFVQYARQLAGAEAQRETTTEKTGGLLGLFTGRRQLI